MLQQARNLFRDFAGDESGATAIEYGLIVAGIASVIIVTVFTIGNTLKVDYYGKVSAAFENLPK
jgi:pilus assembly protein Flp/PilA